MNARSYWFCCFLGLAGCGGTQKTSEAPAPVASSDSKAPGSPRDSGAPDFDALVGREAAGLAEKKLTGPEGRWTARVGATGVPKVTVVEGMGVVDVPIGSEASVRCQVFAEDVDPAGTVSGLLASAAAKVEFKQISPWNVRVAKEAPAMYVRAIYLAKTAKGNALGELKIGLHSAAGHPVLCVHDELGYEKTFLDLTTTLFESLEHRGAEAAPSLFVEIQSAKMGDTFVGFSKTLVTKDGVNRQVLETSTLMMPTSPTDLRLTDNVTSQTVDKNGRLLKGVWVESVAGKVEMNVRLEREKGAVYRYLGEIQGKPVKGTFKAKSDAGLTTSVSVAKVLVNEIKKPNGFSIQESGYYPSVDPTQAFEVHYSREKADPVRLAHFEAGNLKFTGHIDDQGLFEGVQMPVGSVTLTFQRELIRGKL